MAKPDLLELKSLVGGKAGMQQDEVVAWLAVRLLQQDEVVAWFSRKAAVPR